MIPLEKLMILAHLQILPKNVVDLGKLVAAKGFKKLPKVQKIAKSGHTVYHLDWLTLFNVFLMYECRLVTSRLH